MNLFFILWFDSRETFVRRPRDVDDDVDDDGDDDARFNITFFLIFLTLRTYCEHGGERMMMKECPDGDEWSTPTREPVGESPRRSFLLTT